jgi:hypothetical protein
MFTPDNKFLQGAHMHSNLRSLVGAADYALYVKDPIIYSRVDALYRYVRSGSTRFGFLAEVNGRKGDIVACETCTIMDYVGLAVTLANHGHPEYWGDVERIARNHMIESQVSDVSWLKSDPTREDTGQFTWRDVGERMIGGFAGWSSPNHILACKETLNAQWGGPELRDKTRAFQNCCGGSGLHGFFTVWKNAARFESGRLSIHIHIDKLLPESEIRCYQPYDGLLTIKLNKECNLRVRIPDFTAVGDVKVESNGKEVETKAWGNYLELGQRSAGEEIKVMYPLPIIEEEITIGNPGFRKYRYRVTYKGDTVVRMVPVDNDFKVGYSEFDKKEVPVYYGTEGPCPLYQRERMMTDIEPEKSAIQLDNSPLDLWLIG